MLARRVIVRENSNKGTSHEREEATAGNERKSN
jgi:hypothetical protein